MAEQRLIDANELKKGIMNHCAFGKEWDRTLAICEIDSTPTVDAMPIVHGHWIEHGTDEAVCSFSECSVCGTYIHMCHKFCEYESENYCPHCGSRMDEQGGESNG